MKITNAVLVFGFVSFFTVAPPSLAADTLQEYFKQGQAYFDEGSYDKAVASFEKAADIDPNFAPVYNALGLAHEQLGDKIEDVAWFFKVAVEIDPKYADAYCNMCKAYYQAQQYDPAEEACLKALTINPELSQAQMSLAWVYLLGKSNPTEALHYFEKILTKTKSPVVYFGVGMAYFKKGDNARVLETITTLRAMGAGDWATQLEKSIRQAEPLPPSVTSSSENVLPPSQSGTLVHGQPTPPPLSKQGANSSPISGQMSIRLKGKMQGDQAPVNTRPAGPTLPSHPGSLTP